MKPDKVLSMIGMAAKAGKVVSGEFSTEKAVKNRCACLVIVAQDASENTKKHFNDMCIYRQLPYYEYAEKEKLGNCIGKQFRASLAILDEHFADVVQKRLMEAQQLNNGGNK